ncbi:MAG: hypothetical protein D6698_09990 [Gammaproteobacteria bacterium]|nr:MAG: hypothetical protein D6698_09990 [Gammaproteobacteria bacterium]
MVFLLVLVTIATGLFAGGIYVRMGLFVGMAMTLSIIVLLNKMPLFLRRRVVNHPFASDLVLSSLATATVGSYLGGGLTLGVAAIVCAVALSLFLPFLDVEDEYSSQH